MLPGLRKLKEAVATPFPIITVAAVQHAYNTYHTKLWALKSTKMQELYYFIDDDLKGVRGQLPLDKIYKLILMSEDIDPYTNPNTHETFTTLLKPVDPAIIQAVKSRFEDKKGHRLSTCFEIMCLYPASARKIAYMCSLMHEVKEVCSDFPYLSHILTTIQTNAEFTEKSLLAFNHFIDKYGAVYKFTSDLEPFYRPLFRDLLAEKFLKRLPKETQRLIHDDTEIKLTLEKEKMLRAQSAQQVTITELKPPAAVLPLPVATIEPIEDKPTLQEGKSVTESTTSVLLSLSESASPSVKTAQDCIITAVPNAEATEIPAVLSLKQSSSPETTAAPKISPPPSPRLFSRSTTPAETITPTERPKTPLPAGV